MNPSPRARQIWFHRELPYGPAAPSLQQRPDRWQHPTTCRYSSKTACISRGVHRWVHAIGLRHRACRLRFARADGQISWNPVQPQSGKNISLRQFARNTFVVISSRPAPDKGAYRDRHERWVRDAVDAGCGARRARPTRTAKSCGPGAPMLASTRREFWRNFGLRPDARRLLKSLARLR